MIPACARIIVKLKLEQRSRVLFGARNGLKKPCRYWQGARSKGGKRPGSGFYGSIRIPGVPGGGVRAHVAAAWVAGILKEPRVPEGRHLDHRCERSLCIEDDHFELIPSLENIRRRWTRRAERKAA
jgi:hypothetical protein